MVDILIVGAGPTGLALACDLARSGIDFRIVDAASGPSTIMKATVLMPLSLEYFADLGLVDRCLDKGIEAHDLIMYAQGERIVRQSFGEIESPYPFLLLLGQHNTERFLLERLGELGHTVSWNTRLVGLERAGPDGTHTVDLAGPDGAFERVTPRFVVGCDGAKSSVAQFTNVAYRDLDFPTDYVVAEVEIDCAVSREAFNVFFSEDGPLAVAAMPDGRWGVMAALAPRPDGSSRIGTEASLAELQALWDARCPFPGRLANPTWMSHYRDHVKVAKTAQPPGILLAGDAVHQVSPLSSLGMNSGLLDARNLGWKLALAARGIARPAVLDSYGKEHFRQLAPAVALSVLNEIAYPFRAALLRKYRDAMVELLFNFGPFWRLYTRFQTQKDRSLRGSPIVDQHVGLSSGAAHRSIGSTRADVGALFAFAEGPHAGDLAPDVGHLAAADGSAVRLFDRFFGGRHTLVLFEAEDDEGTTAATATAAAAAAAAMDVLTAMPDDVVRMVRIVRHAPPGAGTSAPRTAADADAAATAGAQAPDLVFDPEGAAHARYGAAAPCLYLVRPDGYVGFRAHPPEMAALRAYLDTILVRTGSDSG